MQNLYLMPTSQPTHLQGWSQLSPPDDQENSYLWQSPAPPSVPAIPLTPRKDSLIPDPYVIDKLRTLGRKYFNNTETADCWLWIFHTTDNVSKDGTTNPNQPTPTPVAVLPAHSLFLTAMSSRFRTILTSLGVAKTPLNPMNALQAVQGPTAVSVPVYPPSPDAFTPLLHWIYTADVGEMRDFLLAYEDAIPAVIANAEWLGLHDSELELLCRGVEEETRDP